MENLIAGSSENTILICRLREELSLYDKENQNSKLNTCMPVETKSTMEVNEKSSICCEVSMSTDGNTGDGEKDSIGSLKTVL